tara:strand:- start:19 stop:978 length:960 start_codon:yes stop_codon:yes gene_type:complete
MSKVYSIKKLNKELSQNIWEDSFNLSIFSCPDFLYKLKNIEIYGAYKGEEIVACWPIRRNAKLNLHIPYFFYYFGPFFSSNFLNKHEHSRFINVHDVYTQFLEFFQKKFESIHFETHYTSTDIRAFDWWNYKNKNRFKISPQYTAIIKNLNNKTEQNIISNYRYVRRYELKKFTKFKDDIYESEITLKQLITEYFKTVKSDLKNNDLKKIMNSIKEIYNLAKSDHGKIVAFKDKKNKNIVSIIVLLFDKNSSHLIINLTSEKWKKTGISTWSIHNAIMLTKSLNINNFDFNGANSPRRGDNKHSFGSESLLYFNLKFNF